jgi:hypothetical protein
MKRPYGSGQIDEKSGAYYARWRTPDGRRVNRRLGPKRARGSADGLTRFEAEQAFRRIRAAEATNRPRERDAVTQDVERLARAMLARGAAPKTVRNLMELMHSVFALAVKEGWANSHPVAYAARCEADPDLQFLTLDELDAVIEAIPDRMVDPDALGPVPRLVILAAVAGRDALRERGVKLLRGLREGLRHLGSGRAGLRLGGGDPSPHLLRELSGETLGRRAAQLAVSSRCRGRSRSCPPSVWAAICCCSCMATNGSRPAWRASAFPTRPARATAARPAARARRAPQWSQSSVVTSRSLPARRACPGSIQCDRETLPTCATAPDL